MRKRIVRKRLVLLAAWATTFVSGCGTIANLNESRRVPGRPPKSKPFGGVREDIEFVTEIESGRGRELLAIFGLVDLPFSLVGDVFTLPWTIRAARQRKMWPTESTESTAP